MLTQVERPLVMSGFYTGVDAGRYRIFQLHQSYLRVSGGDPIFVHCTGGELERSEQLAGLNYVTSDLSPSNPISSLVDMARCASELADSWGRSWIVSTQADIWGPRADWALQLVLHGLSVAPDCALIGFRYGESGVVARLLAAKPSAARLLFTPDHAARYFRYAEARPSPLYEAYLLERIRALGLLSKLVLLPSRAVLKKASPSSRARTFVPSDPLFTHDHAHDYGLIRRRWRSHPAPR